MLIGPSFPGHGGTRVAGDQWSLRKALAQALEDIDSNRFYWSDLGASQTFSLPT
jgi:hypothetical protein